MFTIDFDDLMLELEGGTVKHVGAPTSSASAKLYHVTEAEVREFGDRVKLVFDDDEGNHVEVAVDPEVAERLVTDVERLREESSVFE